MIKSFLRRTPHKRTKLFRVLIWFRPKHTTEKLLSNAVTWQQNSPKKFDNFCWLKKIPETQQRKKKKTCFVKCRIEFRFHVNWGLIFHIVCCFPPSLHCTLFPFSLAFFPPRWKNRKITQCVSDRKSVIDRRYIITFYYLFAFENVSEIFAIFYDSNPICEWMCLIAAAVFFSIFR